MFGGVASSFSSMLECAVGPVSLFDPGPAFFVKTPLPSCSSLFPSTSLPVFHVCVVAGEAEVHRAVSEGVLRETSNSSTTASPQAAVVPSSKRSVSTAVAPKTNSARSTRQVDSGQGFATMCVM